VTGLILLYCDTIIIVYVTIRSATAQNGDRRNYFVQRFIGEGVAVYPLSAFGAAAATSNADFSSNEIGLTVLLDFEYYYHIVR